jgi:hypothetical protein
MTFVMLSVRYKQSSAKNEKSSGFINRIILEGRGLDSTVFQQAFVFSFLHFAVSVLFPCFALVAEVRRRFYTGLLVDVDGVLCAVFAPMPFVALTSPYIFHQSNHFVSISCLRG